MKLEDDCNKDLYPIAYNNAFILASQYRDSVVQDLTERYMRECMSEVTEDIEMKAFHQNHQTTLYYYDLSGNLRATVPPAGYQALGGSDLEAAVDCIHDPNCQPGLQPNHELVTYYTYNSLNEVIKQATPDGGTTEYYYDRLGRIVASQNEKQKNKQGNVYSYTIYDEIGRVIEAGEVSNTALSRNNLLSDPTYFETWIHQSGAVKSEIVRNFYDAPLDASIADKFPNEKQDNLRNRVASTTYQEHENEDYGFATHYSYDIHGNVKDIIQDIRSLEDFNGRFKLMHYEYDLISGNVLSVAYQEGAADQFFHQYEYDADNRIEKVLTSRDGVIWDHDADYKYYRHGPMSRINLGEHNVQGIDYAYTLQGWLKVVNSNTLVASRDMGQDGESDPYNFAKDAYGFSLSYYDGDYKAIGRDGLNANDYPIANEAGTPLNAPNSGLYNGNIRHMVTSLKNYGTIATAYKYDQLNRIVSMQSLEEMDDVAENSWKLNGSLSNKYATDYSYDDNGNLLSLKRNSGDLGNLEMDDLTYHYKPGTNQLTHVNDAVAASAHEGDIDDQGVDNYDYDEIGNLIKDEAEEIAEIKWTLSGKVKEIKRTPSSSKPDLVFRYDPMGNRTVKIVKFGSDERTWQYTYYVRDAQGNVMGVYGRNTELAFDEDELKEEFYNWFMSASGAGEAALADMYQEEMATNAEFFNAYRDALIGSGDYFDVLDNYTAMELLNLEPNLVTTLFEHDGYTGAESSQLYQHLFTYCSIDLMTAVMHSFGNDHALEAILMEDVGNEFFVMFEAMYGTMSLEMIYTQFLPAPMPPDPVLAGNDLKQNVSFEDIVVAFSSFMPIQDYIGVIQMMNAGIIEQAWQPGGHYGFTPFSYAMIHYMPNAQIVTCLDQYPNDAALHEAIKQAASPVVVMEIIRNGYPTTYLKDWVLANSGLSVAITQEMNLTVLQMLIIAENQLSPTNYNALEDHLAPMMKTYRQHIRLKEHHLYGSSRLGLREDTMSVFSRKVVMDKIENGKLVLEETTDTYEATLSEDEFSRYLGYKRYELSNHASTWLSNHLGNVLSTITDRKLPETENDLLTNYQSDITQESRYYPVGMMMSFGDSVGYGFGFNSQERISELHPHHYTAEYWEYDGRLGRRWNLDPVNQIKISNYATFKNNPVYYVDIKGDKWAPGHEKMAEKLSTHYEERETAYKKTYKKYFDKLVEAEEAGNAEEAQKYSVIADNAAAGGADMAQAQKELKEMGEKEDMTFYFKNLGEAGGGGYIEWAGDWSNEKDNNNERAIIINFNYGKAFSGLKTYGNLAHETKHAFQVLMGYITPSTSLGNRKEMNHKEGYYQNERDAYTRQFFVSPSSMPIKITTFFQINKPYIESIKKEGKHRYNFKPSDYGQLRKDSVH